VEGQKENTAERISFYKRRYFALFTKISFALISVGDPDLDPLVRCTDPDPDPPLFS
jgi:hypothetical protein